MAVNPKAMLDDIAEAQQRLLELADSLDETLLVAPSQLEGWTRSHLLAHLENLAAALARQAEYAARGQLIEVYDGGRAGRNADIEAGATRSAAEHRRELRRSLRRIDAAWPSDDHGWLASVSYSDGTVLDVLHSWWREIRIHLVDLNLGESQTTWSEELCEHLLDFLEVRLPASGEWMLRANDLRLQNVSDSGPVTRITGDVRDLAAWLAGRKPATLPLASIDGNAVSLPELGPWPSPPMTQRP